MNMHTIFVVHSMSKNDWHTKSFTDFVFTKINSPARQICQHSHGMANCKRFPPHNFWRWSIGKFTKAEQNTINRKPEAGGVNYKRFWGYLCKMF